MILLSLAKYNFLTKQKHPLRGLLFIRIFIFWKKYKRNEKYFVNFQYVII